MSNEKGTDLQVVAIAPTVVEGADGAKRISWKARLAEGQKMRGLIDISTPDAIAIYLGQLTSKVAVVGAEVNRSPIIAGVMNPVGRG